MRGCWILLTLCVLLASGQRRQRPGGGPRAKTSSTTSSPDDHTDKCPEAYGFFADAYQCDRYYECVNGSVVDHLCPDGFSFSDFSTNVGKCEFHFAVDCSDRPELQPPQPSLHCPRKNGYFRHEEYKVCDKFYYCVDGAFNMLTCPGGLVFSEATGTCTWPDEAKRKGCSSEDVFEFKCPERPANVADSTLLVHPRFPDPKDCQFFYVCINGQIPRRNGCSVGQVFNEANQQCDEPKNVPECEGWYKGILDYDDDGNVKKTKPRPKVKAN